MSALADLERKYLDALDLIKSQEKQILALTAQVEELSEIPEVPPQLRLTGREAKMFVAFMRGGLRSKEQLLHELYAGRWGPDSEPGDKIIDVFVCKLRKKMKPFGLEIETRWGQGYLFPAETKARARQMVRGGALHRAA